MMKQYVRIPDFIDVELRKLQGSLIRDLLIDVSYATVVNVVFMGGLLAADKLSEDDWRNLRAFLLEQERMPFLDGKGDAVRERLVVQQ